MSLRVVSGGEDLGYQQLRYFVLKILHVASPQQLLLFGNAEYINLHQRGSSLQPTVTVKVAGWTGRW